VRRGSDSQKIYNNPTTPKREIANSALAQCEGRGFDPAFFASMAISYRNKRKTNLCLFVLFMRVLNYIAGFAVWQLKIDSLVKSLF